jgi:hypothetical protein
MTKLQLTSAAVIVLVVAIAIPTAFLVGKRVADKAAYVHGLEVELRSLKEQRTAVRQETSDKVDEVVEERKAIRTPQQATDDINQTLGTHVTLVQRPDEPEVSPVSHFDIPTGEVQRVTSAITSWKVQSIQLAGCQKELGLCDLQVKNLEKQLKASKPSTLKKLLDCSLKVAVPAGIGKLAGGNGWAVAGGAAGAGSCVVSW